jgi:1-acyl-sn-glycerol-3-phosphate acyltransferase
MFLLFFLYNYYIIVREYVLSNYKLTYINQQRWGRDIFKFNKWFYGWRQYVKIDDNLMSSMKKDKILMMANHVNLTDIFQLQEMINTLFPYHKMTYLVKKDITNIPFFGEFIKNNHIIVGNNHEENIITIQKYMKRLQNERIILFIFPEGSIYHKDNIKKSDEWCKKQNISLYQSCMCPKTRGLYTILNAFSFDAIIQTYLTYPDDIKREKATNYSDFLINKLPRISEIYIKDETSFFNSVRLLSFEDFSSRIYEYWREVDNHLTQTYKEYENKYIEFMNHKHIYHDVVIDYVELTWNSSKYIIIVIPIAYLTHGYFYCLSLITLLLTSYQYHIHKKWKYFDIFMACLLIMLSYVYNTHLHSNIFLTIGIVFYLIEKLIEFHFKMSNHLILYYLHTMLHMFAYTHILVEFLHHYT